MDWTYCNHKHFIQYKKNQYFLLKSFQNIFLFVKMLICFSPEYKFRNAQLNFVFNQKNVNFIIATCYIKVMFSKNSKEKLQKIAIIFISSVSIQWVNRKSFILNHK